MFKCCIWALLLSNNFFISCCLALPSEQPDSFKNDKLISAIIEPQTRAQWKQEIQWPDACDEGVSDISFSKHFKGFWVYPWSEGRRLVSVVCSTGTYNLGETFYLETEKASNQFTLLVFPQFISAGSAESMIAKVLSGQLGTAPYYQFQRPLVWGSILTDMSGYTITNENRYRGAGGCGILTSYQIVEGQPQVSSLRIKEDCTEAWLAPELWPLIKKSDYASWPLVILEEEE